MRTRTRILIALLVVGVMLIGLATVGMAAPKAGKKIVVGVSLLTRAHDFYKDLEAGMRAEAAKNNMELKVVAGEFDATRQKGQVQDFVTQKVDAIVVCPTDTKAIAGAIRLANRARIPVFTADIAAQGGDVVSHVASDNVMGGRLAGEYLAKVLKGKGKVVVIDQPAVKSVQDRVRGFEEAIRKYPGIKIVQKPGLAKGLRPLAKAITQDMLQRYPDLSGIFGSNDDCALGALMAVRQAKRSNVSIVGYDAIPEARTYIASGSPLKADTVQYPKEIGKITVQTIVNYLNGKKVAKLVPIKVGIVDQKALAGK